MKTPITSAAAIAAGALLVGGVVAMRARSSEVGQAGGTSELTPLPRAPQETLIDLIEWQPFELEEPGVHTMRAETPTYREGALVVLRANPGQWTLRQSYDNVLYVGAETATRINAGTESGYLVAIVPGPVDLGTARIFLGEPELPERVTKAEAVRQSMLAARAGVQPLGSALARVPRRPLLQATDEWSLYQHAAVFVERYAPDERDLLETLRVERLPER